MNGRRLSWPVHVDIRHVDTPNVVVDKNAACLRRCAYDDVPMMGNLLALWPSMKLHTNSLLTVSFVSFSFFFLYNAFDFYS